MKFAVGFTVSAREDQLAALARLAGCDNQAAIRRFLREEAERAVLDHFARRGVRLRLLHGVLEGGEPGNNSVRSSVPRPPRLDENAVVLR